jgi:hypothetical protein
VKVASGRLSANESTQTEIAQLRNWPAIPHTFLDEKGPGGRAKNPFAADCAFISRKVFGRTPSVGNLLLSRLSALQRQRFCGTPVRAHGKFHSDKWLAQILPGDRGPVGIHWTEAFFLSAARHWSSNLIVFPT